MSTPKNMQDPTLDEMLTALKLFGGDSGYKEDMLIAIYWFADQWHSGQASNLYSVLSTSPYVPGPMTTLENEGDNIKIIVEMLETFFHIPDSVG